MTIHCQPLVVRGQSVGDLISVGHRVMLFTVRAAFAKLDGMTFDSANHATDIVTLLLDKASDRLNGSLVAGDLAA